MGRGAQSGTVLAARQSKRVTPALPAELLHPVAAGYEDYCQNNLRIVFANTPEGLDRAIREIRQLQPTLIGVDFETAKNVRLMQLSVDEPERGIAPRQYVIDCFAVEPSALRPVFADRKIEKTIQWLNIEQDWAMKVFGEPIVNTFDTCRAWRIIQAHLAEMSAAERRALGIRWRTRADASRSDSTFFKNKLNFLTEHILGFHLPKEEQNGDWERAQLTAEQVVYAALDVAVLPELTRRTKAIAEHLGLTQIVTETIESDERRFISNSRTRLRKLNDASHRVHAALKAATTVDELDRVWDASRQVLVLHENRETLRQVYESRQQLLAA